MAKLSAAAIKAAKAQAAQDAALAEALAARDADPPAPEPRGPTIGDQFLRLAELIADAKRRTRLQESTLIKAWELNLMWIHNERQLALQEANSRPSFPYEDIESGGTGEDAEADDLPIPNEVLGEVVDDSPTKE